MKKSIIFIIFLTAMIFLAACSGNTETEATEEAAALVEENASRGNNLNSLMFGMVLLEESETPLTAEQAEELIPLWQLMKSLVTSGTAAQEEIEAVAASIEGVLTETQLDYLETLEVTPESMSVVFESLGIEAFGRGTGEKTGEDGDFTPPEGIRPGGGPGGGLSSGEMTEEQQATMEARRAEGGGAGGMMMNNPEIFDALIAFLEAKAAE